MSVSKILHITNGDCSVAGMRDAGVIGDMLPWRDVLHLGPVVQHDDWQSFDQSRADFLVSAQLGQKAAIEQTFAERFSVMSQVEHYAVIYLWFEHDLYDQLQLLQILMWLSPLNQLHDRVQLIVTDLYLGTASVDNFHELFRYSEPLQPQHLIDSANYWKALTHGTPELLNQVKVSAVLPFMCPAFKRLCGEYPSQFNGLNHVQNTILKLLDLTSACDELFALYQQTEEAKFLGDTLFVMIIEKLVNCESPLIQQLNGNNEKGVWHAELVRTDVGTAVMKQHMNHLDLNQIDSWVGGVHLKSPRVWCYDNASDNFTCGRGDE